VARGTSAGLLDAPAPQSIYKLEILRQYVIRYATMTASKLTPPRAVLFDGFAGSGRYSDGSAGSAEHMMLAAQKARSQTQIDIFVVEQDKTRYDRLNAVANEYRGRGIAIESRHGDCGSRLAEVMTWAKGASLFLFLDPCGAVLPFDQLFPLLRHRRSWPRTELLMNFNADLIRRAGGQYKKGQLDLGGVASADKVCGGEWWREVALQEHLRTIDGSWESAAQAVAVEYAHRLTDGTNFDYAIAPVRRKQHHQPVYFLIFLTGDAHGFWVFGAAAAKAREEWIRALGPDDDEADEMLFDVVAEQLRGEQTRCVARISQNLRSLVADGKDKSVVDHAEAVFEGVYGEAKETAFSAALRALVKAGEVEFARKGAKPHQHIIRAGRA
jgi:three-Cys-motif partner protein